MMTLESLRLSAPLQALVDARLDTIDRMLLGVVPRQDRMAIARDVESQIHELLQNRNVEELSREDVIAVLTSLDPPEAYLPEEGRETVGVSRPAVPLDHPRGRSRSGPVSNAGLAGGILGITMLLCSMFLPVLALLLALVFSSIEVFVAGGAISVGLVLTGSIIAVVLASRSGLRSGWAITGLITGLLAVPLTLALVGLGFLIG